MNRHPSIKQNYVGRTYEALTLLNACKTCDKNNYPHTAVSIMLYRCRFADRRFFKNLFEQFIETGYNPLRRGASYEETIYIKNIIARL